MAGHHRPWYGAERRDEKDRGGDREHLGNALVSKQATDHRTCKIEGRERRDAHHEIRDEDRGSVLRPNLLHADERHVQSELGHACRERHEEPRGGCDAEVRRREQSRNEDRHRKESALLDEPSAEVPHRGQLGRLAERFPRGFETAIVHGQHPLRGSSRCRSARGPCVERQTTGGP